MHVEVVALGRLAGRLGDDAVPSSRARRSRGGACTRAHTRARRAAAARRRSTRRSARTGCRRRRSARRGARSGRPVAGRPRTGASGGGRGHGIVAEQPAGGREQRRHRRGPVAARRHRGGGLAAPRERALRVPQRRVHDPDRRVVGERVGAGQVGRRARPRARRARRRTPPRAARRSRARAPARRTRRRARDRAAAATSTDGWRSSFTRCSNAVACSASSHACSPSAHLTSHSGVPRERVDRRARAGAGTRTPAATAAARTPRPSGPGRDASS